MRSLASLVVGAALLLGGASGDELTMKDGTRHTGTVIGSVDGDTAIRTADGRMVVVRTEDIARMQRSERKPPPDIKETQPGLTREAAGARAKTALQWLARHQEADGHWDAMKWESVAKTDAGLTGLALLAFLQAGHSEKDGPFKDNVARALAWIVGRQEANGCIGAGFGGSEPAGCGYHHAICALALTETYRLTGNPDLAGPAQKAVDYSVGGHQVPGSGWRYTPRAAGETSGAGRGVADLSVTGWFVMQLKSAKDAGLKVPASGMEGALTFLDQVSDRHGKCSYQPATADGVASPSPTMTSVGLLCRLVTGTPPTDPSVAGGADYLMRNALPDWGENGCHVNMYYWYHGTRVMVLVGDPRRARWEAAVLRALGENQRKADQRHPADGSNQDVDGSWDPVCPWGAKGGRVYSTAMGAMILELCARQPGK